MDGKILKRLIAFVTLVAFFATSISSSCAQAWNMPAPGTMVSLSAPHQPAVLQGMKVYPENPFRFDFILNPGEDGYAQDALKNESNKLIRYFLASLTVPEQDLWVNLSPYEKDRIIAPEFGNTEMGRDLLAQDYLLKQITASVIYPQGETGKKFWSEIYRQAQERFGTTDIPVDTFNKVWIVPEKAVVYEKTTPTPGVGAVAYVVESRLKVMLETDYLAQEKDAGHATQGSDSSQDLAKSVLREVVIPILETDVNEGKNFAPLRQVYQSLILAAWYKKKIKEGILARVYVNRKKIEGLGYARSLEPGAESAEQGTTAAASSLLQAPSFADPESIWRAYVESFKKGAFNLIREEQDTLTGEMIPRKYFSGGVTFKIGSALENTTKVPDEPSWAMMLEQIQIHPGSALEQTKGIPQSAMEISAPPLDYGPYRKINVRPDMELIPEGDTAVLKIGEEKFFELSDGGRNNHIFVKKTPQGDHIYRVLRSRQSPWWDRRAGFDLGIRHQPALAPRILDEGMTRNGYYFMKVEALDGIVFSKPMDAFVKGMGVWFKDDGTLTEEGLRIVKDFFRDTLQEGLIVIDPKSSNFILTPAGKMVVIDAEYLKRNTRDISTNAAFYINLFASYDKMPGVSNGFSWKRVDPKGEIMSFLRTLSKGREKAMQGDVAGVERAMDLETSGDRQFSPQMLRIWRLAANLWSPDEETQEDALLRMAAAAEKEAPELRGFIWTTDRVFDLLCSSHMAYDKRLPVLKLLKFFYNVSPDKDEWKARVKAKLPLRDSFYTSQIETTMEQLEDVLSSDMPRENDVPLQDAAGQNEQAAEDGEDFFAEQKFLDFLERADDAGKEKVLAIAAHFHALGKTRDFIDSIQKTAGSLADVLRDLNRDFVKKAGIRIPEADSWEHLNELVQLSEEYPFLCDDLVSRIVFHTARVPQTSEEDAYPDNMIRRLAKMRQLSPFIKMEAVRKLQKSIDGFGYDFMDARELAIDLSIAAEGTSIYPSEQPVRDNPYELAIQIQWMVHNPTKTKNDPVRVVEAYRKFISWTAAEGALGELSRAISDEGRRELLAMGYGGSAAGNILGDDEGDPGKAGDYIASFKKPHEVLPAVHALLAGLKGLTRVSGKSGIASVLGEHLIAPVEMIEGIREFLRPLKDVPTSEEDSLASLQEAVRLRQKISPFLKSGAVAVNRLYEIDSYLSNLIRVFWGEIQGESLREKALPSLARAVAFDGYDGQMLLVADEIEAVLNDTSEWKDSRFRMLVGKLRRHIGDAMDAVESTYRATLFAELPRDSDAAREMRLAKENQVAAILRSGDLSILAETVDRVRTHLRQKLGYSEREGLVSGAKVGELVDLRSGIPHLRDISGKVVILNKLPDDASLVSYVSGIILTYPADQFSHPMIVAKGLGVPVAVVYDPQGLAPYLGQSIELAVTETSVEIRPSFDNEIAALPGRKAEIVPLPRKDRHAQPEAERWVVLPAQYEQELVSTKPKNIQRMEEASGAVFPEQKWPAHATIADAFYLDVLNDGANRREKARIEALIDELGDQASGPRRDAKDILRDIRDEIMSLKVSEDVLQVIRQRIPGGLVMVRSASNVEDQDEYTGAGLHDSVEAVDPASAFFWPAIKSVWASLWSQRAYSNRELYGIGNRDVVMEVLVQAMVPSEYSFTVHTQDPHVKDSGLVIIEATPGMGKGAADPSNPGVSHRFSYDPRTGEVRQLVFGNKDWKFVIENRRFVRKPLDSRDDRFFSVRPEDREWARRLIQEIGEKARKLAGKEPRILEAAYADQEIFFVQMRNDTVSHSTLEKAMQPYAGDKETVQGPYAQNEDAVWLDEKDARAAVVADGLGGVQNGQLASQIAVDTLRRHMEDRSFTTLEDLTRVLREGVLAANQHIFADAKGGLTTVSVAYIWDGPSGDRHLVAVNIGDSSIFLERDGALEPISDDDTVVRDLEKGYVIRRPFVTDEADMNKRPIGFGEERGNKIFGRLFKAGLLERMTDPSQEEKYILKFTMSTTQDAVREEFRDLNGEELERILTILRWSDTDDVQRNLETNPLRHEVTSVLGRSPQMELKTGQIVTRELRPGDRVWLMTDGVSDNLGQKEISGILTQQGKTRKEKLDALLERVNDVLLSRVDYLKKYRKPDDRTVAVLEVPGREKAMAGPGAFRSIKRVNVIVDGVSDLGDLKEGIVVARRLKSEDPNLDVSVVVHRSWEKMPILVPGLRAQESDQTIDGIRYLQFQRRRHDIEDMKADVNIYAGFIAKKEFGDISRESAFKGNPQTPRARMNIFIGEYGAFEEILGAIQREDLKEAAFKGNRARRPETERIADDGSILFVPSGFRDGYDGKMLGLYFDHEAWAREYSRTEVLDQLVRDQDGFLAKNKEKIAQSEWYSVYSHSANFNNTYLDAIRYADQHDASFQKKSKVVFMKFDDGDMDVQEITDRGFRYIDMIRHTDAGEQKDNPGQVVVVRIPGGPHVDGIVASSDVVGATGDMSFTEALFRGKRILYEQRDYKKDVALGDFRVKLSALLTEFGIDDKEYRDMLFPDIQYTFRDSYGLEIGDFDTAGLDPDALISAMVRDGVPVPEGDAFSAEKIKRLSQEREALLSVTPRTLEIGQSLERLARDIRRLKNELTISRLNGVLQKNDLHLSLRERTAEINRLLAQPNSRDGKYFVKLNRLLIDRHYGDKVPQRWWERRFVAPLSRIFTDPKAGEIFRKIGEGLTRDNDVIARAIEAMRNYEPFIEEKKQSEKAIDFDGASQGIIEAFSRQDLRSERFFVEMNFKNYNIYEYEVGSQEIAGTGSAPDGKAARITGSLVLKKRVVDGLEMEPAGPSRIAAFTGVVRNGRITEFSVPLTARDFSSEEHLGFHDPRWEERMHNKVAGFRKQIEISVLQILPDGTRVSYADDVYPPLTVHRYAALWNQLGDLDLERTLGDRANQAMGQDADDQTRDALGRFLEQSIPADIKGKFKTFFAEDKAVREGDAVLNGIEPSLGDLAVIFYDEFLEKARARKLALRDYVAYLASDAGRQDYADLQDQLRTLFTHSTRRGSNLEMTQFFRGEQDWEVDDFLKDNDYLYKKYKSGDLSLKTRHVSGSEGHEPYSVGILIYKNLDELYQRLLRSGEPLPAKEEWLKKWNVEIHAYDFLLGNLMLMRRGYFHEYRVEKVGLEGRAPDFFEKVDDKSEFYQPKGAQGDLLRSWVRPHYLDLNSNTVGMLNRHSCDITFSRETLIYLEYPRVVEVMRRLLDPQGWNREGRHLFVLSNTSGELTVHFAADQGVYHLSAPMRKRADKTIANVINVENFTRGDFFGLVSLALIASDRRVDDLLRVWEGAIQGQRDAGVRTRPDRTRGVTLKDISLALRLIRQQRDRVITEGPLEQAMEALAPKEALSPDDISALKKLLPGLDWAKASLVPWLEVIRYLFVQREGPTDDPDIVRFFGSKENQRIYWENNTLARKEFLFLVRDMLLPNSNLNVEDYAKRLAEIQFALRKGAGSTIYKSDFGGDDAEMAGRIPVISEKMEEHFNKFKELIHYDQSKGIAGFLALVIDYYRLLLEDGFIFGYGKGNNSVYMNMVNGLLRLHGLNGISHDIFDMQIYYDKKPRKEICGLFINALRKTNRDDERVQALSLEDPLFGDVVRGFQMSDGKSREPDTGGIDLTPSRMDLKTTSTPGVGEVRFNIDPAMLQQWEAAPGVSAVIIDIQPLNSLKMFLGVKADASGANVS